MIVRAFSSLWKVDRRLYAVESVSIPGEPTYPEIFFFVIGFVLVRIVLQIFGLANFDNALIKYAAIPIGFSMFMTKKRFNGKRPDKFLWSIIRFYSLPRHICKYRRLKAVGGYEYTGFLFSGAKEEPRKESREELQEELQKELKRE